LGLRNLFIKFGNVDSVMEILDDVPVELEPEQVLNRLGLRRENEYVARSVLELIDVATPIAKPKALYEVSFVDEKNEDSLFIGGIKFTSHVLRVNLDKVERVFPYVATCGTELDEMEIQSSGFMKTYYLDAIKRIVLDSAVNYLTDHLKRNYALKQISKMNPGSLEDWPLTQQKELFSIFGDVEGLIGVKLKESFLMVPQKSVSGIYFPTEIKFESCQLCPREVCSGRRAPYDPELVKKYREGVW
jgi:hypothetical protein